MIKYCNETFLENSIIEFCILPDTPLDLLINNIKTDLDIVYIDARGTLSTIKKCHRLFSYLECIKLFKSMKTMNNKLVFLDSITAIIDSCINSDQIVHTYNSLWKLIYFNNFTFIVINHYRFFNKRFIPRLGSLWLLNITYRIMIKNNNDGNNGYEIAKCIG